MAIDTSAVEAAVRAHRHETADEPVANHHRFREWQVSDAVLQDHGPSTAKRRRAFADNGSGGAGKKIHLRSPLDRGLGAGRKAYAGASELFAAEVKVHELEQDIGRAEELLRKSRRQVLSDVEWRELSGLLRSTRHEFLAMESRWGPGLGRLAESGDRECTGGSSLPGLRRALANARKRFVTDISRQANPVCREDMVRRIELRLPGGSAPAVVESRSVPGAALGVCFPVRYPREEDRHRHGYDLSRFYHVPGLEQTRLCDSDGALLYSGLRHGFIQALDLDAGLLSALPDDSLWSLVANLVIPECKIVGQPPGQAACTVERICSEIGTGSALTEDHAEELRRLARQMMVREAAAAALVGDSDKYRRALDGETVELLLVVISLMEDLEDESAVSQWRAFNISDAGALHVGLEVRDPDGEVRRVPANVSVLQFEVSMDPGEPRIDLVDWAAVNRLLGSGQSEKPEELVGSRIHAMRSRARELKGDIHKRVLERLPAVQRLGVDHAGVSPVANLLFGSVRELRRLENGIRTLEQADRQLKVALFERGVAPMGVAEGLRVAARLGLLAHLMGGTPLLSCTDGTPYAKALEAEIMFLAAAADNREGRLPPLVRHGGEWQDARSAFDEP